MKIIYYYPKKAGAPSKVARSIFNSLQNRYLDLCVFQQTSDEESIDYEKTNNLKKVSLSQLLCENDDYLVHFTQSPTIFPNKKFLLFILSMLKKYKMIINYHGEPRTEFLIKLKNLDFTCLPYTLNYIFSPLIMKYADTVILNSFYMKHLFEQKYSLNNLIVIPNGIDPIWLKPLDAVEVENKAELDKLLNRSHFTILYHGRLAPEKGVDILLQGFSLFAKNYHVMNEHCPINLIIVGEGPQKSKFEKFCIENNIHENVIFLGFIPSASLKYLLQNVDGAVYPSVYEPFSLAILEALCMANAPVMYAENIGINDFAKKYNYSFHTFTPMPEAICSKFTWLLENHDSIETSKLVESQRLFSGMFSWDKISEEYSDVYDSILV